jgi:hypothetical protein
VGGGRARGDGSESGRSGNVWLDDLLLVDRAYEVVCEGMGQAWFWLDVAEGASLLEMALVGLLLRRSEGREW